MFRRPSKFKTDIKNILDLLETPKSEKERPKICSHPLKGPISSSDDFTFSEKVFRIYL